MVTAKNRWKLFLLLMASVMVYSCTTETPGTILSEKQIGDGQTMELALMHDSLLVGHNRLVLRYPGHISVDSMSVWGSTGDGPANPLVVTPGGAISDTVDIFLMNEKSYLFNVLYSDKEQSGQKLTFTLHPVAPHDDRVLNLNRMETEWLGFIVEPRIHRYGIQPLIIAMFNRPEDGDRYRPLNSMDPKVIPWMQMDSGKGHSSPYNVNPVRDSTLPAGFYKGQVSYSMKGQWDVRLVIPALYDTLSYSVQVKSKEEE